VHASTGDVLRAGKEAVRSHGVRKEAYNMTGTVDAVSAGLYRARNINRVKASAAEEKAVRGLLRLAEYGPKKADNLTSTVNAKGKRIVRVWDIDRLKASTGIEEAVFHIGVANNL